MNETFRQAKVEVGKLADKAIAFGPEAGARLLMAKRKSKPKAAAMIGVLLSGALIERGEPGLAANIASVLAKEIEDDR